MTTNKVKSHSTRSLLCLILFRKNIFCRGQSLDACYQRFMTKGCKYATKCQCPLGLIPHFYSYGELCPSWIPTYVSMPSRADISFLHEKKCPMLYNNIECQCPLGLISHFYMSNITTMVMAYLLCQCPLGLISHFYHKEEWLCTK